MLLSFNEAKFNERPTYLVVELLQQAVQPGLSHLHGPSLVGYVADFDENHHQLRKGKTTGRVLGPPLPSCFPFKHSSCTSLTTSRCSLLLKSKAGRMDLNLLRISLCLVMSVAKMHLRDERTGALTLTLRRRGETDEGCRRMISLDDALPDPFVLVHSKVSEDVALCLESGKSSVYSPFGRLVQNSESFWAVPALYLLQYLKGHGAVVVLQRRDVVVAESQLSPGIDLKNGYWKWSGFFKMFQVCPI